jgi:hypothetical protein
MEGGCFGAGKGSGRLGGDGLEAVKVSDPLGNPDDVLAPGTLNRVQKQAGLKL